LLFGCPHKICQALRYLLFKFDCSIVKLKPTNGSKDNVSHAEFWSSALFGRTEVCSREILKSECQTGVGFMPTPVFLEFHELSQKRFAQPDNITDHPNRWGIHVGQAIRNRLKARDHHALLRCAAAFDEGAGV
jgi:hypothetical protein